MTYPAPSSSRAADLTEAGLVAVSSSSPPRLERQRSHLSVAPLERAPLEQPAAGLQLEGQPCRGCGGSGMLRINVQSHRTCMDCLGGGQRLLTSADLLRRVGIRAVVSSSGAG